MSTTTEPMLPYPKGKSLARLRNSQAAAPLRSPARRRRLPIAVSWAMTPASITAPNQTRRRPSSEFVLTASMFSSTTHLDQSMMPCYRILRFTPASSYAEPSVLQIPSASRTSAHDSCASYWSPAPASRVSWSSIISTVTMRRGHAWPTGIVPATPISIRYRLRAGEYSKRVFASAN